MRPVQKKGLEHVYISRYVCLFSVLAAYTLFIRTSKTEVQAGCFELFPYFEAELLVICS